MKTLLKYWLPTMAFLAVLALIYLLFNWTSLSITHKLSFAVTIALVLHILEEERFPAGFGSGSQLSFWLFCSRVRAWVFSTSSCPITWHDYSLTRFKKSTNYCEREGSRY